MFNKLLLALATFLCITAQAATPPSAVVKQAVPIVKGRGEIKGNLKIRATTALGVKTANNGEVAIKAAPTVNIQEASSTAKMPNLIGSVVQSNSGLAVGIYSINENGLNAIKTGYTMNACNGGAALDGKYICCFMDQFNGQVYGAYYRIFDMSDWSLIEQNYNADFDIMSECMTSDGSVIYGCFYNKQLSGYELGTMSLDPVARTVQSEPLPSRTVLLHVAPTLFTAYMVTAL